MPVQLSIEINPQQLADLQKILSPKELNRAVFTACNKLLGKTRTSVIKAIKDETGIARKYVIGSASKPVIVARKTNSSTQGAVLTIKKQPLPLIALKAIGSKSGGVAVKLGPLAGQVFRHAFISSTTVDHPDTDNAHKGVFQTFGPKVAPQKGKYAGRRLTRGPQKGELILRRSMKELYSPSILTMFTHGQELQEKEFAKAMEDFPRILASQVQYVLSKRTPPDETDSLTD